MRIAEDLVAAIEIAYRGPLFDLAVPS